MARAWWTVSVGMRGMQGNDQRKDAGRGQASMPRGVGRARVEWPGCDLRSVCALGQGCPQREKNNPGDVRRAQNNALPFCIAGRSRWGMRHVPDSHGGACGTQCGRPWHRIAWVASVGKPQRRASGEAVRLSHDRGAGETARAEGDRPSACHVTIPPSPPTLAPARRAPPSPRGHVTHVPSQQTFSQLHSCMGSHGPPAHQGCLCPP